MSIPPSTDFWEVAFSMKEKEGRRGSSVVEAALLFPLVIFLTISGFSLMARWYSSWEEGVARHKKQIQEERVWGNDELVKWKQWSSLWKEEEHEET